MVGGSSSSAAVSESLNISYLYKIFDPKLISRSSPYSYLSHSLFLTTSSKSMMISNQDKSVEVISVFSVRETLTLHSSRTISVGTACWNHRTFCFQCTSHSRLHIIKISIFVYIHVKISLFFVKKSYVIFRMNSHC